MTTETINSERWNGATSMELRAEGRSIHCYRHQGRWGTIARVHDAREILASGYAEEAAALFAASPELYKACKAALPLLESIDAAQGEPGPVTEVVEVVRAALKKAQGSQ